MKSRHSIMFQVQPKGVERPNLENPIKLRTFVELTMDVASASPRRYFFEARWLYVQIFGFYGEMV